MNELQELREEMTKAGIYSELHIKSLKAKMIIKKIDKNGYRITTDTGYHNPLELLDGVKELLKESYGIVKNC